MVVPFGLLALGVLLAYSGLKNKTVLETLKGLPGSVPSVWGAAQIYNQSAPVSSATGGQGNPAAGGPVGTQGPITGKGSAATKGAAPKAGNAPGGSPLWGGAAAAITWLTRGYSGSGKRSTRDTASGNISDHWVGARFSYAKDIPASGSKGTQIAHTLATRLGKPDYKGGYWLNVEKNGYRYQIGWRVPDHYDHVHAGARRLDHMASG